MSGGTTRAERGETIHARAALPCAICGTQIPAQALHSMPGATTDVLCGRCVSKPALHSRYWPRCSRRDHDLFDHPLHQRSRAAARAYITAERNTQ